MQITVFAKKRTTKEGKVFYNYLTNLTNKTTGAVDTASVKFRESAGQPKPENCPCNIVVEREDVNLATTDIMLDDGRTITSRTLWVTAWKPGDKYVDHSMDDYL